MPRPPTPLRIKGLTRRFGEKTAVSGLDLEVRGGEIHALLGPNGAGKTTTMKVASGLLAPTSGDVEICGFSITRRPMEAKRRLAFIPDGAHMYEKLTGMEFLSFIARLFEVDDWEERAERYLDDLDLAPDADSLIESYSHGMRRKILLIAGLLHGPDLWILDEPMSGLDPASMRKVERILLKEADRGATVLLSTHTLVVAERIAERITILDHGKKRASGTLSELRAAAGRGEAGLEEIFFDCTETG